MAKDKNGKFLYRLQQNDNLLGRRGRIIPNYLYTLLPEEFKNKFKSDFETKFSKNSITNTTLNWYIDEDPDGLLSSDIISDLDSAFPNDEDEDEDEDYPL